MIFSYNELDNVYDIFKNYLEYCRFNRIIKYDFDSLFRIFTSFDWGVEGALLLSYVTLFDIEDDGKTLLEHCSPCILDNQYTEFVIDKDIDDIVINVSFKDLSDDFFNQIGVNYEVKPIISKAFLNILNRQNDKSEKVIKLRK